MSATMAGVVAALEGAGVVVGGVTGLSETGSADETGLADETGSASESGLAGLEVRSVQQDSRRVGPGDLFVAWAGAAHDAHRYLTRVAAAGAAAALVERPVRDATLPQIQVDNARLAAATAAGYVAGSPWKEVRTVGVTGTNGKTSVTLLLRDLLAGQAPAAAVGTLGVIGPDGRVQHGTTGLTTPGPVDLVDRLSDLARAGIATVVMEASSHALDQYRLDGIRFDVAAFTNLTRDHLDYHGTWERYLAAKARLLALAKERGTAVLNADDPAWDGLRPTGSVLSYGIETDADVTARRLRLSATGSAFDLAQGGRRASVSLPLPGGFNVSNALCAAACALALGWELEAVASGLSQASPVRGRMERVAGEPFPVFVDFAHTPDALEQVLKTLRPLVAGRLIVVFGAGGDRDPAKRPMMGAVAGRRAHLSVVTSDNPRTEDPAKIVAEVAAGVPAGCSQVEIVDRLEAIGWALDAAEPGDVVLLAGKGHETTQEVGGEKLPFDERTIVADMLARRNGS